MLAGRKNLFGEAIKRAREPFSVDVNDFRIVEGRACRMESLTIPDIGYQRDGDATRQTRIPLPADLRNRSHPGPALISREKHSGSSAPHDRIGNHFDRLEIRKLHAHCIDSLYSINLWRRPAFLARRYASCPKRMGIC